jgi:hypothetical protein
MDVKDFDASYPEIDDPNFQQKLYSKTEFYKLGQENIKSDPVYYTFQKNLGILLSPVTPYNKMLFFLEPGVGKTCSSILVHEISKHFLNNTLKPTIIITKGKSLEDNYKNDFIKICPGIEKQFEQEDRIIDKTVIEREVKQNFSFKKYSAFASYLSKLSDETIKETYSNRNFVLDEAQTIKNTKGKTYKQYDRLFHLITNATIILLSGTPNTDHPSEAAGLINLLKPKDEQIQVGNKFLKHFYNHDDLINENELLTFYKGYVTYLRQTSDITPAVYEQNSTFPSTFENFKTYNLVMRSFQESVYEKALKETHKTKKKEKGEEGLDLFKRDKEGNLVYYESKGGGTFMKLAREAATFCYPDGTYGAQGFKKNLTKVGNKIEFKDKAMEEELKTNLKKYSISFAESFKIIQANPQRVFYMYFDNVNNSGLLMYAKLLELVLGFQVTDGKKTPIGGKPKYVKIDGSQKTPISQIMRKVGSKENADGQVVRVVLGSPLSGVGLTIPNATVCMIFDAQFTPSDIEQIVNRINRPGTLKYVEEAGLPTDCKNYIFTASTKDHKSIDLDIYAIAEHKIRLIRPQTELMKRADPLCLVSYNRNSLNGQEPYKCLSPKTSKKDETTDVLYWSQAKVDEVVSLILDKIKDSTVKISDYLDAYEPMIVYRAVKSITTNSKILDNGIIFLFGDLIFVDKTASGDPNASWYLETETFSTQTSLNDIFARQDLKNDQETIKEMYETKDTDLWDNLSKFTRIGIWETLWNTKDKFEKKLLNKFKYYDIEGVPFHILYAEPYNPQTTANANAIVIEKPDKIRFFRDGVWQYYRDNIPEIIAKIKDVQKEKIKQEQVEIDTSYGMYGKYDAKGQFQIVVLGKGRSSGKVCKYFPKPEQREILAKVGKIPKDFDSLDKDASCKLIEEAFQKKNLIK